MEMIYIAGRSVPCGDYNDALDALQYAYPEEWDALHYIRRDVAEVLEETENENNSETDAVYSAEERYQTVLRDIKEITEKVEFLFSKPRMTANVRHDLVMFNRYIADMCDSNT